MDQNNLNHKEYGTNIFQSNQTSQRNVRLLSALAYILFFVPLLVPDIRINSFARHHVNNAFILQITNVLFFCCLNTVITFFISFVLSFFTVLSNGNMISNPDIVAGLLVTVVGCLWYIGYFVFVVMGIIKAYSGEHLNIPLLNNIKIFNR